VKFDQGVPFVDAREDPEYEAGHIRGARHMNAARSPEEIQLALAHTPKDRELIIYCDGEECGASTTLATKLQGLGFANVQIFFGGWTEWKNAGLPTSRASSPVSS